MPTNPKHCDVCKCSQKLTIFTLSKKNAKDIFQELIKRLGLTRRTEIKICELHFEKTDWLQHKNGKRLNNDAKTRMPPYLPPQEISEDQSAGKVMNRTSEQTAIVRRKTVSKCESSRNVWPFLNFISRMFLFCKR